MVKKILILSILMLITLLPYDTFAEVLDGTASIGSGVIHNGSSYGFTPNISLTSGSSNEYSYSSAQDNPFIMGARYVTAVNLGSAGANTFSGVVEIPVAITYNPSNGVSTYNRPNKSAFHVGLGSFYDWGTLDFTVNEFTSSCGDYAPVEFSFPYRICVYRVSFTAKSNKMIYGSTNFSFSVYDWSNANNLVFQPLGHSWGSGNFNGSWVFPRRSTDIDGGENIAPYYVLSYGNNISETLLQQQIEQNQQIINQNQTIINQQNQNTNSIINNQDSNTQDIIDNQNSNTDKEIESQKVCSSGSVTRNLCFTSNSYLDSSGRFISSSNWCVSDYINVQNITNNSTTNAGTFLCFYDKDKTRISCSAYNSLSIGTVNLPTNTEYVRFSISSSIPNMNYSYCENGNQALNDTVNDLNDTLNSETPPDTENQISNLEDTLISDTPISDLITMPLSLINAYISGINSSCSPVNLGNLYGTDLILPCINLEQRFGSNLWSIIDTFFCIFMCYNIGMLFITAFEGITSLRDDFDGLYQPRHADVGYQPKHGGGN